MSRVFVDRDTVNDESVVVRKLYKSSGESVESGTLVLEYETSKTAIESHAPEAGVLTLAVSEGDEIAVGALLYELSAAGAPAHSDGLVSVATAPAPAANDSGTAVLPARVILSNEATALAEELRVDVTKLSRTGWLTATDVRELAGLALVTEKLDVSGTVAPLPVRESRGPFVSHPAPRISGAAGVAQRPVKTSVRKRTEARTLTRANSHGAISTIGTQIRIEGRRLARPPSLFSDNISDLVAFELARLLRLYPTLNAFYVDEQQIGLYDEVHVGMSFDGGSNLKVLAIRNSDAKTLTEIQQELMSLLELYESDRPIPLELLGSATVTISDLSGTGADFMLPLINGDQSLIVGITRGPRGFGLHASFDHRISEGLEVAKLLDELGANVASHFSATAAALDLRCSACDRAMSEELALGHRGFLKITLPDGAEGRLCRSCFEGF